jgi:hypothetical protein
VLHLLFYETFYGLQALFTRHGLLDAKEEKYRVLLELYRRLEGVRRGTDPFDQVLDTVAQYENMIVGHHLAVLLYLVFQVPHRASRRFRESCARRVSNFLLRDLLNARAAKSSLISAHSMFFRLSSQNFLPFSSTGMAT